MRILEINKFFYVKGGADRHFLDVVELLEKGGHEVAVFAMQHPENKFSKWEEYFVSYVGYSDKEASLAQQLRGVGRMFYSFEAKRKINALLDKFKPEIVHVHNIYHQLSPIILFEIKKRGIPIVMTVHDFKLVSPNYNLYLKGRPYNRCEKGQYYRCFLDKAVKNSYAKSFIAMLEAYWHNSILKTYAKNVDRYIVPSFFVKQKLGQYGVDKRKITILPHFISSFGTKHVSKAAPDKQYALYFGRINKEKGIDELAAIFEQLGEISLYLAGKIEADYELPPASCVKYVGNLAPADLSAYIEGSQFVVSGSNLPETFGLVALETAQHGKPFIGYRSGGFAEIITNGENGYLARSEKEFMSYIRKAIEGSFPLDTAAIKANTEERFGRGHYQEKVSALFKELINR